MTDIEYIWSKFDQVIPVVSHIIFSHPEKPKTPNNIDEAIKGPHKQIWKEALFVKYNNNKSSTLFGYHANKIPPLCYKGPTFTYLYNDQVMQLFQCMENFCTPM